MRILETLCAKVHDRCVCAGDVSLSSDVLILTEGCLVSKRLRAASAEISSCAGAILVSSKLFALWSSSSYEIRRRRALVAQDECELPCCLPTSCKAQHETDISCTILKGLCSRQRCDVHIFGSLFRFFRQTCSGLNFVSGSTTSA